MPARCSTVQLIEHVKFQHDLRFVKKFPKMPETFNQEVS
ncbi:hypothetical protein Z949_1302 [Sulfitobacter guttiformis KCTC 32187]|nr:hypothetical protein Z949_1302 [Sulfitobacter guttiformis KCTC 32187]